MTRINLAWAQGALVRHEYKVKKGVVNMDAVANGDVTGVGERVAAKRCRISTSLFKTFLSAAFLSDEVSIYVSKQGLKLQNYNYPNYSTIACVTLDASGFLTWDPQFFEGVAKITFNRAKTLRMLRFCKADELCITVSGDYIRFNDSTPTGDPDARAFSFTTDLLTRQYNEGDLPTATTNHIKLSNVLLLAAFKACQVIDTEATLVINERSNLVIKSKSKTDYCVEYQREFKAEQATEPPSLVRPVTLSLQLGPMLNNMLTLMKQYDVRVCMQYDTFIIFDIAIPHLRVTYYLANLLD